MNPEKSPSSKPTDDVLKMLDIDEMSDATLVDKHTDANTPLNKAAEIADEIDRRQSEGDFDWEGSLAEGELKDDRAAARRLAATANLAKDIERYEEMPTMEPVLRSRPSNPRAALKKRLDRSNPNIINQIYHRGEKHRRNTTEVPNVTMSSIANGNSIGHENSEQRRKTAQIETGERRAQESRERRASLQLDELQPVTDTPKPIESKRTALSDDEAYLPDYEPGYDEFETPGAWGRTIDDDSDFGYSDDYEDINVAALREIERQKERAPLALVEDAQDSFEEESAIEPLDKDFVDEIIRDPEDLTKLGEVFEVSQKIRERVKDPGSPRYRILSMAAVKLERVELPSDADERVEAINQAIELAARKAIGKSETEDTGHGYAGDSVAAIQLYIGEGLIGSDADSVSVGTTKVIYGASGRVGIEGKRAIRSRTEQDIEDGESAYRNLVVIRWIKDNINHVVAFSPNKDAAMYAFVDDSMGDSWRRKIIMAGSIQGDDRKDVIIGRHTPRSEKFHHEDSIRGVAKRILDKEIEVLDSSELSQEEHDEKLVAILQREIALFSAKQVATDYDSNIVDQERPDNEKNSSKKSESS